MKTHVFFLIPLSLCATSCSISTQVQYQDVPLGSRPYARTNRSGQYEAAARVEGSVLEVSLSESASCDKGQVRSVHRTEHRLRQAHPSPWALAIPGVVLAGLGVGTILGRQTIAAELGLAPLTESPLAYQIVGGAVSAAGVGLILGSVIHAVRARDTYRDLGNVEFPEIIREACRAPVTQGLATTLSLSATQTLSATVDGASRVRFSMLEVPSELIPSASSSLGFRIQERDVGLALSSEQSRQLRSGLLADERSVARQELLAQLRERCTQAAGRAQRMGTPLTKAQVDAAVEAWELAKSECGFLFSAEMAAAQKNLLQAQERLTAEESFFASARSISEESTVEELSGKVVYIEKAISLVDDDGGYIKFEREQTVCMRTEEPVRTRWGRGGGRGGGRWGGGGGRRGGSWFRGNSRGSSYRPKPGRRWYGGSAFLGHDDSDDPVDEITASPVRQQRCRKQKKVMIFRLSHPAAHRLKAGDFVKVYALATPSRLQDTMHLVEARVVLLTRGLQVLISVPAGHFVNIPDLGSTKTRAPAVSH